jgi:hypothetical protein
MLEEAIASKKANVEKKTPNILVIELVNQQESNYFLDNGQGTDDNPIGGQMPRAISYPSARMIKARSVIKQWNEKEKVYEHVPIRYIKGCNEILVSKQEAMGFKPVPQEDVIWILNGKAIVIEQGADIGKYRYLKAYEGNVDNEDRPDGAADVFREISTEVEAVNTEVNFDAEFEVLRYLNALKVKVTGRETTYNEDTLQFLCSLFKLPSFDSYTSEAWVALAEKAKENPLVFLTRIQGERAVIEADVNQAIQLGAIIMDQVKAVYGQGNKLITQFPEHLTDQEKVEKLIDLLSNPKSKALYDEVRTQLQIKKNAITGKVR